MPVIRRGSLQRLIAEHTDKLVETLIGEGTIVRPNWWISQRGRFWIFLVGLVLIAALAVWYQRWLMSQAAIAALLPNGAQVGTALIAAEASVFAYYQWIDARRESSLERFYDRLRLTNERFYEWEHARNLVQHFWGPVPGADEFQRRMYIYLELDNLEYMIFRYQLGFVRKPLLRRAIRTFSSRCEALPFGTLAVELVEGAGYDAKTVQVVGILVAQSMASP